MAPATAETTSLKILLGRSPFALVEPGVPVLAGDASDGLFAAALPAGDFGAVRLFKSGDWLLGVAVDSAPADLDGATHRLYGEVLGATRGLPLARIWNFVPAINAMGASGRENYQEFCSGRSLAFEQARGADFARFVPAASAVGGESSALTVVFAASAVAPRHLENSLQLPAWEYPPEYGRRAPSFARATLVRLGRSATVFISGTAAIRGHATVAPGDLAGQLDCTLGNLREIGKACGLGADLARGRGPRHFRVYLRRAADLEVVAATLAERLLDPADGVAYVRADICRQDLLVEIEATLLDLDLGRAADFR